MRPQAPETVSRFGLSIWQSCCANLGQIVGACESFIDGALIFSGHQVPLMRLFIGVAAERRAVPLPRRTSAGLAIYEPGIQSGVMSPPRAGAEDADGVFVIERDFARASALHPQARC
jgi:hypothetical protein